MAEYRIKITTNHNGETVYVPQEGYVRQYGLWKPQKEVVWIDLLPPGKEFSKKETASACLRLYMRKSSAEFKEEMWQNSNEPWPTERQMQYIKALEENTGNFFTGVTKAEASAVINANKKHPGNQNEWAITNGY
jgi:hypothetical protein